MKKTVGILLQNGFHEVRMFILSGLVEELKKDYEVKIFTLNYQNRVFSDYLEGTQVEIINIEKLIRDFKVPKLVLKIEAINLSIRRSYLKKSGKAFRNYQYVGGVGIKDKIKGLSVFRLFFNWLTRLVIVNFYYNKRLEEVFYQYAIDKILFSGYSGNLIKQLAVTGYKTGRRVDFLVNSWKDLYINDFVGIPFDNMFVWSDKMKKDFLLFNGHLDKGRVLPIGNPAFQRIFDFKPTQSKQYYQDKYGINENDFIIFYTMINPVVIQNEWKTILLISKLISENHPERAFKILVRKNPMDDNDYQEAFKDDPNILIEEHFWVWDDKKDLTIQTKAGEDEWLDLLFYSDLNISIASTVSIEFILFNKPIININFDFTGKENKVYSQFNKAAFYVDLYNHEGVNFAESPEFFRIESIFMKNNKDCLPNSIINSKNSVRNLIDKL